MNLDASFLYMLTKGPLYFIEFYEPNLKTRINYSTAMRLTGDLVAFHEVLRDVTPLIDSRPIVALTYV